MCARRGPGCDDALVTLRSATALAAVDVPVWPVISERGGASLITLAGTPARRAAVAYECRTSCSRMRGSPADSQCLWNRAVIVSAWSGRPSGHTNNSLASGPRRRRSCCHCSMKSSKAATVSGSRAKEQTPARVFVSDSWARPATTTRGTLGETLPRSRSISCRRRPASSPRRRPVGATRSHSAKKRSFLTCRMKAPSCWGFHT